MEEKNPYEKVIKKFLILIALLAITPLLFSFALRSYNNENFNRIFAYVLLVVSSILLLFTTYFGMRTLQSFVKALFESEKDK